MKAKSFGLLPWFVFLLASVGAWCQESDAVKSVETQTGFRPRFYERVRGPGSSCGGDVAELAYEETEGNIVLRLGERLLFADLGHHQSVDTSDPGCRLEITNTLSAGSIRQAMKNTCASGNHGYEASQALSLGGSQLTYSFRRNSPNRSLNSQFTCVYRVTQVENPR